MRSLVPALAALVAMSATALAAPAADVVTLSIVTTTDLHGNIAPRGDQGGLALFGGYLANLRAARAADGGAVLLVDSGDTFQGGIESDLSEGAVVVDAYAALGYTAAVIGNHEFDFGAADGPGARQLRGADPRGAIQARAAQAPYPVLAANLLDDATGRVVAWPNVRPSALVTAAGVKIGIVGLTTSEALRATLRANVHGLRVAPLLETVVAEAAQLRTAGARVVIVVAHAGGACAELGDPQDLSSCEAGSEIFALANGLPRGLVDVIAAGHTHQAVAHEVAGIAIVQAYALGRAFGRVDLALDRRSHEVVAREIFAPRDICAVAAEPGECGAPGGAGTAAQPARYEGQAVVPDPAIEAAMAPALARVRALQATPLGVLLDTPIARGGPREAALRNPESPLGNLFADAERERTGADVAINNNVRGGLRADLPEGPLTFGRLYDVFPFDNRLVTLAMSGAELRALLEDEVRRNRPGSLGLSGIRARVGCKAAGALEVEVERPDGAPLGREERVVVAAMDSLVRGPVFSAVPHAGETDIPADAPVLREVVEDWLRARGGHLAAGELVQADRPRWQYAEDPTGCLTR
ncbi:MAG TPA: bifunctional UDP-sugar hydrolase/5'-nucleotidase [Gammaproteobacteria bacterium]|nr:bifunctional UDP-sugar hydrolase/5'-nucleotidase [Gammaproteobacteria bacterium]